MIRLTVEIGEGAVSRRMAITASSIGRALGLAGSRKPGKKVRVVFPIDPESFFVRGDIPTYTAAPIPAAA